MHTALCHTVSWDDGERITWVLADHHGRQWLHDFVDGHQPPHCYGNMTNRQPVHGATDAEAMPRWYIPKGREDDTLLFESRFESGNLSSAEKM